MLTQNNECTNYVRFLFFDTIPINRVCWVKITKIFYHQALSVLMHSDADLLVFHSLAFRTFIHVSRFIIFPAYSSIPYPSFLAALISN